MSYDRTIGVELELVTCSSESMNGRVEWEWRVWSSARIVASGRTIHSLNCWMDGVRLGAGVVGSFWSIHSKNAKTFARAYDVLPCESDSLAKV